MSLPNLDDYPTQTAKSLVSIQKIDDKNYAFTTKKYSEIDGSELPSETQGVTVSEVDNQIAALQAQIDTLNTFKANLMATI